MKSGGSGNPFSLWNHLLSPPKVLFGFPTYDLHRSLATWFQWASQFGPGVKAWVLDLYYAAGLSQPKLLEFLHTVGLLVSNAQLSNWLILDQQVFHEEKQAVVQAGLASTPWQHLDSTATGLAGQLYHCHILCNPLYTAYTTLPTKDRQALLKVLLGGQALNYRLNSTALTLLEQAGLAAKWRTKLSHLASERDLKGSELDHLLEQHGLMLGSNQLKVLKDVMAVVSYQTRPDWPIVDLLITDDAPQFYGLTKEQALCWLHEGRHYKSLRPKTAYAKKRYGEFMGKFWDYYLTVSY